jgi:carbon-monoxide dehydrogenase medium subunit
MNRIDYYRPASLPELWEIRETIPGARVIAGGTDILVKIKNRVVEPPALISLRAMPELRGISIDNGARIGAMTTINELIRHPDLASDYPVLIEAARRLGSAQIRNAATVAGNLCNCSPCADTALPLLVLDARVELQSSSQKREIPLHEFFVGPGESCLAPGEIMTAILMAPPAPGTRAVSFKKGRVKMDLAIASAAVLASMKNGLCEKVRVAAGSVAPVPMRLREVEELLEKNPITSDTAHEAARIAMESVSPITDIRSTEDYRQHITGVFVQRAVEQLAELVNQ